VCAVPSPPPSLKEPPSSGPKTVKNKLPSNGSTTSTDGCCPRTVYQLLASMFTQWSTRLHQDGNFEVNGRSPWGRTNEQKHVSGDRRRRTAQLPGALSGVAARTPNSAPRPLIRLGRTLRPTQRPPIWPFGIFLWEIGHLATHTYK
jgi:hypothetical protein